MEILIWVSLGLNVLQCILLAYFIWRTHQLKIKDWNAEILAVDRALHQRVDSMESYWSVKWEALASSVNANAAKIRRFFSVK